MKNYFEYKGYIGTIEVSVEDRVLFGTINGINDLVTFEAPEFNELEVAFHEAVEDYLDLCVRHGKNPEKTYKGQFNVRIPSELHRKIAINATKQRMSLNQYVEYALTDYADESFDKINQVSGTLEKCVSNLNAHIGEQNTKLWDKSNVYQINYKRESKEVIKTC